MITIHRLPITESGSVKFEIGPNSSLSLRQLVIAISVVVVLAALAITVSALLGLWMVLPFYGLEASLLIFCLFRSYMFSTRREYITVTDSIITIQRNYSCKEQMVNLKRAWVACSVVRPERTGQPSKLTLCLHGRHIEIGRFLAEPERMHLAIQLKQLLPARSASI